ncbi:MAG: hypothetical protein IJR60_05075 [Eubacterium sp.]|nr:hypothetical protein [Eubacterium sp.]
MSSTNKTPYLELNNWVGSDIPKRTDFNEDNNIIDLAISRHVEDTDAHTTTAEKSKINQPFVVVPYTGNGSSSRQITITNDFEPKWGIVFKVSYTPSIMDIDNRTEYNYFGVFTNVGSNIGLSLSGKKLTVQQSATSVLGNEIRSYNENGSAYVIIAFR